MTLFSKRLDPALAELEQQVEQARARGEGERAKLLVREIVRALLEEGRTDEAIEVSLGDRDYASAAELAELAHDFRRAAQLWFRAGDLLKAARARVEAREPTVAAELYERAGDLVSAGVLYEQLEDFLRAAVLFERSGDRLRAADLLVRALSSETRRLMGSEADEACRRAGVLYAETGHLEHAVRILRWGGQNLFAAKLLARAGRTDEAIELLTRSGDYLSAAEIARAAGNDRRAMSLLGERGEKEGRYVEAAAYFEQAEQLARAARLYEYAGEADRAAELYERAGQLETAMALYEQLGRFGDAQRCFLSTSRGLELQGVELQGVELHGLELHGLELHALEGSELHDDAIRASVAGGDYLRAASGLVARARLGERARYPEAMHLLGAVAPEHPDYFLARALLAEVLAEQGDNGAALGVLEALFRGRDSSPDHLPALYHYGRLLELEGYLAAARAAYRTILSFDPAFRDVRDRLLVLRESDVSIASGAAQPALSQPGLSQPGASQPGASQPGASQSGAGRTAVRTVTGVPLQGPRVRTADLPPAFGSTTGSVSPLQGSGPSGPATPSTSLPGIPLAALAGQPSFYSGSVAPHLPPTPSSPMMSLAPPGASPRPSSPWVSGPAASSSLGGPSSSVGPLTFVAPISTPSLGLPAYVPTPRTPIATPRGGTPLFAQQVPSLAPLGPPTPQPSPALIANPAFGLQTPLPGYPASPRPRGGSSLAPPPQEFHPAPPPAPSAYFRPRGAAAADLAQERSLPERAFEAGILDPIEASSPALSVGATAAPSGVEPPAVSGSADISSDLLDSDSLDLAATTLMPVMPPVPRAGYHFAKGADDEHRRDDALIAEEPLPSVVDPKKPGAAEAEAVAHETAEDESAHARASSLQGVVLRGRFRIERRVGRGAQAHVYLARDLVLDRAVAIKVLHESVAQDPQALDRFLREARLAAKVHHSSCIAIFDFGQERGLTFMAMEYFRGRTLRDRLNQGLLEPAKALSIGRAIAEALGAVHAAGIVHRDVKPTNVMVDEAGNARLTDFGVARNVNEEATTSGVMIGTMKYMSPEQARGKEADHRSDIFSLGVMLYEMLAGKAPFGGTLDALIRRVTAPPPMLPEELAVPELVKSLVHKCMQRRPDARYQTVQPLIADLSTAIELALAAKEAAPKPRAAPNGHDEPHIEVHLGSSDLVPDGEIASQLASASHLPEVSVIAEPMPRPSSTPAGELTADS